MRVAEFQDPCQFARRVTPLLLECEAVNSVMLGILSRCGVASAATAGNDLNDPAPLMWAVEDGADVPAAAAVMTPPRPLLLSQAVDGACDALAAHLARRGVRLSGVVAPSEPAERFAAAWTAHTNIRARVGSDLGVYQLERVAAACKVGGAMRQAVADDLDLLAGWTEAFHVEAGVPPSGEAGRQTARRLIEQGQLFLWCDPRPVSMAAKSFPSPNGIRVFAVYTPPENRRRGYASALVAALSRRLLHEGRRFCCLNTDMANPTSNKIYRQIGYRHVGNQRRYDFDPPPAAGRETSLNTDPQR